MRLAFGRTDSLPFRERILVKDPRSCPSLEDIERFLSAFAETHVGMGKGASKVLHYDTMNHAILHLDKHLTFKFEDHKITPHGEARLKATLDDLLRNGLLTRELDRSREPAGAVVARRLIGALYEDAIRNGTVAWDMVFAQIAAILLISCLHCRSGDIMGDTKDIRPDLPRLRYCDLQLSLPEGESINDIKGRFKMRGAKGQKHDDAKFFYYTQLCQGCPQ